MSNLFICGACGFSSMAEWVEHTELDCVRRQLTTALADVDRYKAALAMDTPYRDQATALSACRNHIREINRRWNLNPGADDGWSDYVEMAIEDAMREVGNGV